MGKVEGEGGREREEQEGSSLAASAGIAGLGVRRRDAACGHCELEASHSRAPPGFTLPALNSTR